MGLCGMHPLLCPDLGPQAVCCLRLPQKPESLPFSYFWHQIVANQDQLELPCRSPSACGSGINPSARCLTKPISLGEAQRKCLCCKAINHYIFSGRRRCCSLCWQSQGCHCCSGRDVCASLVRSKTSGTGFKAYLGVLYSETLAWNPSKLAFFAL